MTASLKAIVFITFYLLLCLDASPVFAADKALPPNWPWRGMVVMSTSPPNAEDMQYLRQIGVNAVNIHVMSRDTAKRLNISGREALKKDLEWLDAFLNECKARGITAVISTAQTPLDPAAGLTQDSPEFWDNPELLKEAVYVAGEYARRFHVRGNELGAYSILSEPLVRRDKTVFGIKYGARSELPQAWHGLMKAIVKEIRKYDKTRFIAVTPGLGGLPGGYRNFKPLDDPYIIYEAHVYEPHSFTHQGIANRPIRFRFRYPGGFIWSTFKLWDADIWNVETLNDVMLAPLIEFQQKYNVPVWIGEFSAIRWGEGWDKYLNDVIGLFDDNGWSWNYHCFKCWHGWDPDYVESVNPPDSSEWKLDYRGRDTMRWRLLKAAFKQNKTKEKKKRGIASR